VNGNWIEKLIGRLRGSAALLATLVALLAAFAACLAYLGTTPSGVERSIDEVQGAIAGGDVERAVLLDEDARLVGTTADGERFWVAYPRSDPAAAQLLGDLVASGARVQVDAQQSKSVVRVVVTVLLPLMILANLFALLFAATRGGSGLGELLSFGTVGKKGAKGDRGPDIGFDDIAGADEAVAELREVVDYLRRPERYADLGATPPKGVLLFGPPGCGKTLLAKAVAGEAGVPFFSVAGAEFVESLVGVGAARVRDLFAKVRSVAPAIVFIDELDAAGRRRGSGDGGGGSDEREQTLNQLLVEMDGFDVSSGIVVMGATNRPDILDPALLRPGRFDRHVTVDQPDVHGREEILRLHAADRHLDPTVDLAQVARRTPGFTGADLANVVNEAALLAIREDRSVIGAGELTEAIQRVLGGPQRRGRVLDEDERRRIAVHEAGHALLAAATGHADDVDRVSIVARGRGLGSVTLGRDRDAVVLSRSQLRAQLVASVGGTAAEQLCCGETSTGAEHDLARASDLARDLVGRYGMSERLGPVRLVGPSVDSFLGASAPLRELSPAVHEQFDAEVRSLVEGALDDAELLLVQHRDLLDELAERLLEEETLEGAPLRALLAPVAGALRSGPAANGRRPAATAP
jgi:cell division protease FtsH